MIDRTHELPRSTAYYQPVPVSPRGLALMRQIDELHLPLADTRMLVKMLKRDGLPFGRRRVCTLMKHAGIHALYRMPNTSKRHTAHLVYPYLLRNLSITRSNLVWAADITYTPMKRGFVFLFAVNDWESRRVVSWLLSNTLTTDFCKEAAQDAINRYGKPEIFNTDQSSQFTRLDGKGCWRDKVFVERLCSNVKYEDVYLYSYDCVNDAKRGLGKYFRLYNQDRPHTALDDQTPDEFYFGNLPALPKAE